MALDPKAKRMLFLLVGLAVVAAVPIGMKWVDKRDDPVSRLAKEKRAAKDQVAALAKSDLACDLIEIKEPGGELWAHGCGKRGRYVPLPDGNYRLEGGVVPEETGDGCVAKWKPDAGSAREVAAAIHAGGKAARVRIPIAVFGVTGLAKLRYGEQIDVWIEADAGVPGETVPTPCVDPAADGGIAQGKCERPWSDVSEVDECR